MLPRSSRSLLFRARRRGFALLVTIVLLAFLMLVLVALATFTRVETTVAQNSRQIAQARQNALVALQVAIGQLQVSAGPDQRVTARADILNAAPEAAHWTGVWQAHNPDATNQHLDQDANLRNWSLNTKGPVWLVSSSPDEDAPDPVGYAPDASSSALLARGIGPDAVDVRVPLVTLKGVVPGVEGEPVVGRFAYWVSDEGVKAKVNLVAPTFGQSDFALSQLHVSSPHALPLQRIFPLGAAGDDFRATPVDELAKLFTPEALRFLSTVPDDVNLKEHGPDLTAHSRGVLADVRHGGLKRDLTAAFENPAQFDQLAADHGYGARSLYRSHPSAGLVPSSSVIDLGLTPGGAPQPDGPLWYTLFFHYNTYKPTMPTPTGVGNPGANTATSNINIGAAPYVLKPRVYRVNYPTGLSTILNGIAPVVMAYRVDVALSSYQVEGVWKLRLHYYPQIVLYNPYAARLSLNGFTVRKTINTFRSYQLRLTVGGVPLTYPVKDAEGNVTGSTDLLKINQALSERYGLDTRVGDMDVLEPGETRVFALPNDVWKSEIKDACNFQVLTSAKQAPSTSADWCQWTDIPEYEGTANGDAIVNMQVVSNEYLLSHSEYLMMPNHVQWPAVAEERFMVGTGYQMAPAPSVWSNRALSSLETPVRVAGFFTRFKGLQPSNSADGYKNGLMNIPHFHGNAGSLTLFEDEHSMQWQEIYLSPPGSPYLNNSTAILATAEGETALGDQSVGEGTEAGVRRLVLRDIPSQPMVSLGQFMHAPFYRSNQAVLSAMTFGSMFVGGSLASPVIATDRLSVESNWNNVSFPRMRLHMDDSFMANQELFDRFYFSTVPPATLTANAPAYWTAFNAANPGTRVVDASKPLLNARIKPFSTSGELPLLADLRDSRKAAAHLLLDGAFNVNSTSVPAWRALLSALSGNRLRVWNATGASNTTLDATGAKNSNPIPRFWSASTTGQANAPWDGLRVLDDDEVNELATRIVEQVRARGPFLSMGDFLNRRLGPPGPLTRAGALQAAIDNTSPDINAAAKALGVDVSMSGGKPEIVPSSLYDAKGAPLKTSVGIPGYLMQQDIVQAFSPVMTARSDTFVIRTRGDVLNPATGELEGSAWLEAVVQRTPSFVDQTDPALTALGDATPLYAADGSANVNTNNLRFGRRFVVVNFRWLNENDL